MRLTPRSEFAAANAPAIPMPRAARCVTCRSGEIYSLARVIDQDWVELRLCRRCDADNGLVIAIDLLTETTFAE